MMKALFVFLFSSVFFSCAYSQNIRWTPDGNGYYRLEAGEIVKYTLPSNTKSVFISKAQLTPSETGKPISVRSWQFSEDQTKALIYTNSKKVWRFDTRGDYWVLDLKSGKLEQIGKNRPASSLMFAKFSPDGQHVAYVSEYNLFTEFADQTAKPKQLTFDGNRKFINGTFDWAYEEEFFCRDGFRWSPDSKKIAFWQVD